MDINGINNLKMKYETKTYSTVKSLNNFVKVFFMSKNKFIEKCLIKIIPKNSCFVSF